MKPIAVVYATREGHTRKVAEHVAADLTSHGLEVSVINIAEEHHVELMKYAAVVVAASVHMGRHEREMVKFVQKHRGELEFLPSLFLSVCLGQAAVELAGQAADVVARSAAGVENALKLFAGQTGWHPKHVHAVAGALPFTRYNPVIRFLMKGVSTTVGGGSDTSRDYEYTDWAAVDRFAEELAQEVTAG
jgi:menaquinone-dependent protoporphyrinogen oxidase